MDSGFGVPVETPTVRGRLHDHGSVLTALSPGVVSNAVDYLLNSADVDEHFIDIRSEETVDKFIEELTWGRMIANIKVAIHRGSITGGIFVHSGKPDNIDKRDKATRSAAAVLLRMIILATLLLSSSLPYLLVVPWRKDEAGDIMEFSHAANLSNAESAYYDLDEVRYQVLSNVGGMSKCESLHDVLSTTITAMSTANHKKSLLRARLRELKDNHAREDEARAPPAVPLATGTPGKGYFHSKPIDRDTSAVRDHGNFELYQWVVIICASAANAR